MIVESRDQDTVDMDTLFKGAMVDGYGGLLKVPVTSCFMKYNDLYNPLFRHNCFPD